MKYRTRIIGVLLTLLLHFLIVLPFLLTPKSNTPPPPPPSVPQDEPTKVSVTLIQPPTPIAPEKKETNDEPEKVSYPLDERICGNKDSMYFGVGIIVAFGTDLVTYAPEYYPAYKAGMRIGDFLVNSDVAAVDGWVDFDVLRHMQQMHFHIKADNICFGKG